MEAKRLAEVGYSEAYGKIELVVPYGVKATELAKVAPNLFGEIVGKLPRGCQACLSGHSFQIRERLEHVVLVDLERMEVIEGG